MLFCFEIQCLFRNYPESSSVLEGERRVGERARLVVELDVDVARPEVLPYITIIKYITSHDII